MKAVQILIEHCGVNQKYEEAYRKVSGRHYSAIIYELYVFISMSSHNSRMFISNYKLLFTVNLLIQFYLIMKHHLIQ